MIEIKKSKRQLSREYNEYLKSEQWKEKRTEAFKFYGKECKKCLRTTSLHVHHMTYEDFMNEKMEQLCILCTICHNDYHKLYKHASIESTHIFLGLTDLVFPKKKKRYKPKKIPFARLSDEEVKKLSKKQRSKYRTKLKRQVIKELFQGKTPFYRNKINKPWIKATPEIIKPDRIDPYKTNSKTY